MQMLKNLQEIKSNLSFSYENINTKAANMKPVKACAPQ